MNENLENELPPRTLLGVCVCGGGEERLQLVGGEDGDGAQLD